MKKVSDNLIYPAVFNPAEEGGYNVSFPDFPGCVTFGQNLDEAKEKAAEVLELWLEELSESHQAIPVHSEKPIIEEVKVALPSWMKSLTAKQLTKILIRNGFELSRQKGSHAIYKNQTGQMVPVPMHGGNKPMPIGTFLAIMKQSQIDPGEFEQKK